MKTLSFLLIMWFSFLWVSFWNSSTWDFYSSTWNNQSKIQVFQSGSDWELTPTLPIKQTQPTQRKNNRIIKYWFKDKMFSYNHGTWEDKQRWFLWVDYNQKRDLEDRDFIDVDQAFPEWVDLSLKNEEFRLDIPNTWNKHLEAYWIAKKKYKNIYWDSKKWDYPKFIFVFVHGLNGNKTWWFKDWTFNWNFNRLKHIAYYNDWVYISPTVRNFSDWADKIANLFSIIKKNYPKTKLILACWSSWGETCWKVYNNVDVPLDWIMLLGSMIAPNGIKTIIKRQIPIYYWHWGKDRAIWVNWIINFYSQVKKMSSHRDLIRLEVFTNWVHWTPLRMVDYLKVLQWMFWEENKRVIDKSIGLPPSQDKPTKIDETYPTNY